MKNLRLEPITAGDRYPYYYFRFWEQNVDAAGDVRETAANLSGDYTSIKMCVRERSNRDDPNDHAKDTIYEEMTVDSGNLAHYEWDALETDDAGNYVMRFHLVRTGGLNYHPPATFEFDIVNQMPSKLRTLA